MVEDGYNGRLNMERYATARMARAIKFVPLDWDHPKDKNGNYVRLIRRDPEDKEKTDGYMPDFSDVPDGQIGICAYNTTENVPISPVYPDTPEGRLKLLDHCSRTQTVWNTYRADGETWAGILFSRRVLYIDTQTRRIEFGDEEILNHPIRL